MPSVICSDTEIESDGGIPRNKRMKNKPLMEKKRRARINSSLSQLKQILIEENHKNSTTHSKWEKADILEMTVEYLQQLRSSCNIPSSISTSSNPTPSTSFTPPEEPPTPIPPPLSSPLNPMMQQYMAYQQLAQISMYTQLMSNPHRLGFVSGPSPAPDRDSSKKLKEKKNKRMSNLV